MNKFQEAALKYQGAGFSVIPVKKDKKPYLKSWKKYQTERASRKQIRQWWQQWPDANPAIVTGKISGVDVVDVDTEAGWAALNEFLSDSFETPIARHRRAAITSISATERAYPTALRSSRDAICGPPAGMWSRLRVGLNTRNRGGR